jgi:PadR family transcriptional regulator, regulatory protein PadR
MEREPIRITVAVATVLKAFLDRLHEEPGQPCCYGYQLMGITGFPSGKLYPILARLEAAGWLEKRWEDIDPAVEGRPKRRLYQIRGDVVAAARVELAELHERVTPLHGTRLTNPAGGFA